MPLFSNTDTHYKLNLTSQMKYHQKEFYATDGEVVHPKADCITYANLAYFQSKQDQATNILNPVNKQNKLNNQYAS